MTLQAPAASTERISPEAVRELQARLEAALNEICTLKAQSLSQRPQPDSEFSQLAVKPPESPSVEKGTEKEMLCKGIAALVRTLWLLFVVGIAVVDILVK